MKLDKNKSIGIWGFGIAGKSAVAYFLKNGYTVGVMDKRILTDVEQEYLKRNAIQFYSQEEKENFFSLYEFLLISPGVNIGKYYATLKTQLICEYDFFYQTFKKPIIAVTGSIGKTTVTHILSHVLVAAGLSVSVGGNIGIPTFDLLDTGNDVDLALLEVSSFQLNYCKSFAPYLAIWTNLHPNHLDYHETAHDYFLAKYAIMAQQTKDQFALVPFELRPLLPSGVQQRAYFTTAAVSENQLNQLEPHEQIYFINNTTIMHYHQESLTGIMSCAVPQLSFMQNILIIASVCHLLHIDTQILHNVFSSITLPEHRLEKINGSASSIDFYNDSKSTTTVSTLAAVEKLHDRPIYLFVGGLSKGVDRTLFIRTLIGKVQHIYCFGAEAHALHAMCVQSGIAAEKYSNLEEAFNSCSQTIQPGDCVLLSPAGSSYDLYNDYQERGNHFKQLVFHYMEKNCV